MRRVSHPLELGVGFAIAATLALAACAKSGGGSSPTLADFHFLTTDNLNGEDDDPSVALDAAGALHVVWFSDRDGTKDLYYAKSTGIDLAHGTIAWSAPAQVTNLDATNFPPPTQGDNFPSVLVEPDGTVEVAWFRWDLANQCHLEFAKSDGSQSGWNLATVVDVTSGANFDRFPSLVRFAANDLRIYFSSTTRKTIGVDDVFVASSSDDGANWSAPAEVATLNDTANEQSSFPSVVKLSANAFIATLARRNLGAGNVLDPSSDVFYATSADGAAWTVDPVSHDALDDQADVTPSIFLDHAGVPYLAWTTQAFGDPFGDTVELPASLHASYPSAAKLVAPKFGVADHSPKLVAITVGAKPIFVLVWVRLADGVHNQVVYRLLAKL